MKSITDLDASVAALKVSVEKLIAVQAPVPVDLTPQVAAVDALKAEVDAALPAPPA